MALSQLNFAGKNKIEVAIERLREFEPPGGYYLAFSGGKDSIVIYDLAVKGEVKFDAHYNRTGIDPPEVIYFMREHYPDLIIDRPKYNIWKGIEQNGMPTRLARWCCRLLKEDSADGRYVVSGVRWEESSRRRQRRMFEACMASSKQKWYLHPIIDWTNNEIWEYIYQNELPYCSLYDEGFHRIGCVLCPNTTKEITELQMRRWPKIAEAWKRACYQYYYAKQYRPSFQKFPTAENYWQWWLSRKGMRDEAQYTMFE
jgi:phosphoadenosine phosphosulfate reductase